MLIVENGSDFKQRFLSLLLNDSGASLSETPKTVPIYDANNGIFMKRRMTSENAQ